jgi:PII-like signaling protein
MTRFVLICCGGAVGTGARYLLGGLAVRWFGPELPYGTLIINVLGSFLIGVVQHVGLSTLWFPDTLRVVVLLRSHQAHRVRLVAGRDRVRRPDDPAVPRRLHRGPGPGRPARRGEGRLVAVRKLDGEQVLMRVFIGESDRWEHRPLHAALLELFRREGLAGATVLRAVAGFGPDSVVHTANILRLSSDLPLVIEVVDSQEHLDRVLPSVDRMMQGGLITMEKVRVRKYAQGGES